MIVIGFLMFSFYFYFPMIFFYIKNLNLQNETSLDPSETFSEKVKRFDLEFTGLLIGLLKRITDVAFVNPSDKFINLVHRFVSSDLLIFPTDSP